MTESITVVGYCVLAAALVACEAMGRMRRRTPTLAEALALVTRWRAGRWLVLGGWLWLGWHVFVRGDWR